MRPQTGAAETLIVQPHQVTQQRLVMVMMSRTKERLKVEALRDIATNL